MRVVDVAAVAAACRQRGILSMVDATFATPINLRPAMLGVDLVIHSATKYLNGHCDHLAGVVAGNKAVLAPVLEVRRTAGGTMDPAVAYDLIRGMKTLEIRIERQNATALRLAEALEGHPTVARVHYPFLRSHPDHDLARRQLHGGGGVLSLSVKGGFEPCCRVHDALRIVARASSLGGVESLASIPVISSHRNASEAELTAQGIDRGLLRVSVGLEDADDLLADLAPGAGAGVSSGSASRWLAAGALLTLAGCHPRRPPPDLSLDPAALLAEVKAAQARVVSVQGRARVAVDAPGGSGGTEQYLVAERPGRLRVEVHDFFGNVVAVAGGRGRAALALRRPRADLPAGRRHARQPGPPPPGGRSRPRSW